MLRKHSENTLKLCYTLAACCHQAYICMLLRLEDAVKQGHRKISICTVETDVVILAPAVAQ